MKTIAIIGILLTFGTIEYKTLKLQEITIEEITAHELRLQKEKYEKHLEYMDDVYFNHK